MKKTLFIIAAAISAHCSIAQTATFTDVKFQHAHNREVLGFTIAREQNVRHYRIESGTDSAHMSVVAVIPSRGNSVLSTVYHFDATLYKGNCYRIGKVDMNGQLTYSPVVHKQEDPIHIIPADNAGADGEAYMVAAHQ